ncbi:uncharacterized protein LOC144170591 isoform X2 [Haemaphysalis longicornis]
MASKSGLENPTDISWANRVAGGGGGPAYVEAEKVAAPSTYDRESKWPPSASTCPPSSLPAMSRQRRNAWSSRIHVGRQGRKRDVLCSSLLVSSLLLLMGWSRTGITGRWTWSSAGRGSSTLGESTHSLPMAKIFQGDNAESEWAYCCRGEYACAKRRGRLQNCRASSQNGLEPQQQQYYQALQARVLCEGSPSVVVVVGNLEAGLTCPPEARVLPPSFLNGQESSADHLLLLKHKSVSEDVFSVGRSGAGCVVIFRTSYTSRPTERQSRSVAATKAGVQ